MTSSEIRRIAVIGTGTIGASWAAFFLSRGAAVAASDPAPQAENFLRRFVAAAWPALVAIGGRGTAAAIPQDRLSFHAEPEAAVAEAEFVQENAPEQETLKRRLLRRIDAVRREVKGHVANRLQAALWREAVHLLAEGVASVADIDTAISEGPGLRWALMGPHLTFHLAGGAGGIGHFLDQFAGPIEGWWQDLGHPDLTPALKEKIVGGVQAESAGRAIEELAGERDRLLVEILALKRGDRTS